MAYPGAEPPSREGDSGRRIMAMRIEARNEIQILFEIQILLRNVPC